MDNYEDTVVNPNISLNNFEVRVRDEHHDQAQTTKLTSVNTKKKDSNYRKSIILLVLLAAILVYQVSISF